MLAKCARDFRVIIGLLLLGLVLPTLASPGLAGDNDRDRGLILASMKGNLEEVTRLLDSGADPNAKDQKGWTALEWAVRSGHREVAQMLRDRGADADIKSTPGSSTPKTDKNANANAPGALGQTLPKGDKNQQLLGAVSRGNLAEATRLLNSGADPNAKDERGETALIRVVKTGHLEMARLLMDVGADVNAEDNRRMTALVWAVNDGRSEIVQLLKERGAKIPLEIAATLEDVETVQRLIKEGAHVYAMASALAIAEQHGNKEIADLLRAHGADTANSLWNAKFADQVARRGRELFFRLKDGRIVSIRGTSSHEWSGYPVGYGFSSFIDPWYVIDEHYYESYGTQFINRDTGAVKIVYGSSSFSPYRTLFLATGYPGESPCDAEIWRLSPTNIMREWVSDGQCFLSYQWSGPSTVEVTDSSGHELIAIVEFDDGRWRCSGSSNICKRVDDKPPSDSKAPGKGISKFGSGSTALTKAAEEGDLNRVKELLDNGADVNAKDNHGRTALAEAARRGHLEIVKMLLDRGGDINAEGWAGRTALMCAAERGHREVAKLLIERGAKPTLLDAAALGDAEEMGRLITGGADVNANYRHGDTALDGKAALFWAARAGRWDAVKLLLANGADLNSDADFGRRALLEASKDGHLGVVKVLLDKGVGINGTDDSGWTPLMAAAGEGRSEVVKLLLDRGADINAKDKPGRTALMSAAIRGHSKVAKLLLDKGAEVNAKDKGGWTALTDAAWEGSPEVVSLLLGKSADVDASSERGETALMSAAVAGHVEIVKLLVDAGADMNAKPKFGQTALKIAHEKGHQEIEELLRARGAKE